MDYEVQIGWGKSVRVPPQPVYVAPDKKKDEEAKTLDPPSGLPFNAQAKIGGENMIHTNKVNSTTMWRYKIKDDHVCLKV